MQLHDALSHQQSARFLVGVLVVSFCVSSCALFEPRDKTAFPYALSVCRLQHSGPTNRKIALPATEEHIAKCLSRRGWSPSGERLTPDPQAPSGRE